MGPECGSGQELDLRPQGSLVHSGATPVPVASMKASLTQDSYMWHVPKFCHLPVPF